MAGARPPDEGDGGIGSTAGDERGESHRQLATTRRKTVARVDPAPLVPGNGQDARPVVRHEVSSRTIVRIVVVTALTVGALWLIIQLANVLLMLFSAFLLTAALEPLVSRMARRGIPRPVSVALLILLVFGAVALAVLFLIPPLVDQITAFANHAPDYLVRVQRVLRANQGLVNGIRQAVQAGSAKSDVLTQGLLGVGADLLQGLSDFIIVLVMTVYLLLDGERTVRWVLHFLSPSHQAKVRQSLPEFSRVVSGYVIGQVITSFLFGLYTGIVLTIIGVPQPVLLAVAAALLDAVPVAGIILATAPAVLLALTISPLAAGIVLALYLAYNQLESQVLVPRIYAGRLRISSFAVLVAVLVGWTLLGIIGVLLALPIAAAIPPIERIWRGEPPPAE